MKRFLLKFVLAMIAFGIVYLFATGQIRYYETFRMGGESSGYIGKKSTLLEDKDKLENVFDELSDDFSGKPVKFISLYLSNDYIRGIVQDPDQPTYYDNYRYNGTSILFSGWKKGEPYKPTVLSGDLALEKVPIQGITDFYAQMMSFLKEGNHALDENRETQVWLDFGEQSEPGLLWSNVYGEREDFRFEADFSGNNFRILTD